MEKYCVKDMMENITEKISVRGTDHLTSGGGFPLTRTVNRTESPSGTSRVCRRSINCGGIIDAEEINPDILINYPA